jgi:hypothetical protein
MPPGSCPAVRRRPADGAVCDLKQRLCGGSADVSIHSRLHPPTDSVPADWNRVDCPLPEGRGYREGMSGYAGRQAGISLKGEVSDHKGIFDEIIP